VFFGFFFLSLSLSLSLSHILSPGCAINKFLNPHLSKLPSPHIMLIAHPMSYAEALGTSVVKNSNALDP
jgi:hypothetical protein